jgi:hypothetical protein
MLSTNFFEEMKEKCHFLFIDAGKYQKNIFIDEVLKRYDSEISNIHRLILYSKRIKSHKLKYVIDKEMLIKGCTEINDSSRASFIKKRISTIPDFSKLATNKMQYFDILDYHDIFFSPFNGLKKIASLMGKTMNLDDWKSNVIRSYLPKEVDVFGEIVYPADYGYAWHYEKDLG